MAASMVGRAGLILACIFLGCQNASAFTGPAMFGLSRRTVAPARGSQIFRLGHGPRVGGAGGRVREIPRLAMSSIVDDDEDLVDEYADVDAPKGPSTPSAALQYFASCGNCKASYIIKPADLGEGRKVKCAVCSNIWFQSTSKLNQMKDGYKTRPYPVDQYEGRQHGPIVSKHQRAGAVTLFVGNLPFSITEEKMRDIFSVHGEIASCSIICDPDTGRPKGYGFVDFVEESAGPKAMKACDGLQVDGRDIAVKISEDKFENSRSGFGGRGNRGDRGDRGGFRGRGGGERGRGRGGGDRGDRGDRGRNADGKFIVKRAD